MMKAGATALFLRGAHKVGGPGRITSTEFFLKSAAPPPSVKMRRVDESVE